MSKAGKSCFTIDQTTYDRDGQGSKRNEIVSNTTPDQHYKQQSQHDEQTGLLVGHSNKSVLG